MSATPDITFRAATNADGEKIRALVFGVLREYGLRPEPEGTDSDIGDIEANYTARGGVFEILEDAAGNILGTVGLFPLDAETIELRKMYFDEKLRGRGYGKAALERMIERSREMGYKRMYLETATVLKEAIGLYEKSGFRPTTEGIHTKRCDAAYYLDL